MSNHATAMCAAFVDELVRAGVRHAVIAPGSRSTPLALALAERTELHTEVVLDERVASFLALGIGSASGVPAVVLTTSGTAATHLHAAVAEADLAEVPLLVCTADRPPELYDVGAAQTIDQRRLFGPAVRAYLDLGVPDDANRAAWRSLASRAVAETCGRRRGPVQVNLCFREPLVGEPSSVPAGRAGGEPWHRRVAAVDGVPLVELEALARAWTGRRGVLVAGAGSGDGTTGGEAVLRLAATLGWPVLADPRSGCRVDHPNVVVHADAVLRHGPTAQRLRPDVIVSLGSPPASKVLAQWLAAATRVPAEPNGVADHDESVGRVAAWVLVNRSGAWWDPDRLADTLLESAPSVFARALHDVLVSMVEDGLVNPSERIAADSAFGGGSWLAEWRRADDAAAAALGAAFAQATEDPVARAAAPSEPLVARAVLAAARRHAAAALVVSSSMPIRDLEWYAEPAPAGAAGPIVLANRGANGIDGVVATALGAACTLYPQPAWLLIGDLALLHDSTALLNCRHRRARLRMVVVDNRGGGIFSFLPQASVVAPDRFEQLFGTAQEVSIEQVLAAHGIETITVRSSAVLSDALDVLGTTDGPVAAVVVHTADRKTNTAVHEELHARVRRALDASGDRPAVPISPPAG